MSARWWPALLLLCAACSNGFWACGRGGNCCSTRATVIRDATYAGRLAAGDGGVATQVRLVVGTNGNSRLTFVRDGVEVAETFTATVR